MIQTGADGTIYKCKINDFKEMTEDNQLIKNLKKLPYPNRDDYLAVYNRIVQLRYSILIKKIDDLYNELLNRDSGESYMYDYEGNKLSMDTGYSFDGIRYFIDELKHKISLETGIEYPRLIDLKYYKCKW